MIVLDQPSIPEAYSAAKSGRDPGFGAVNSPEPVNGISRNLSTANMNVCTASTITVATEVSRGIDCDNTGKCKKIQDLLQAFSASTASMVSSKLHKEHTEQNLLELGRGEVPAGAKHSEGIDKSPSSVRQTSSATTCSISEIQSKLKGFRNRYEYHEKEHARALQELAVEISAKGHSSIGLSSVEHLERKILEYNLEMRAKDKTITTLTETLLRLESDFAELWSDLREVKNNIPSFIQQQQQICKHSISDSDDLVFSRLGLVERNQSQLEEQTNLLRDDFEDFRIVETKKFADVSTCDNLRMNINNLSEKVENFTIKQCKRLTLPIQEDEYMSEKVLKLAKEHEQLKGELKLIRDQTKEKEDFHLERMDDMLVEVDELRNDLHKSYQDRNTLSSNSANETGSQVNTPEPRIKEVSNTCAELSCKIEKLQSDITSLSTSSPQPHSATQTQEQYRASHNTLLQLHTDVERNGQQSDVLSVAIQSLEKRFNNLATEEMVDLMVKRVRHLYPNVAAAEEKFAGIFKRLKIVEAKSEERKGSARDGIPKIQKDVHSVQKNYDDVRTWMDAFDGRVLRLEGAQNTGRSNSSGRNQQAYRDIHRDNSKIINNKNGKIPIHNTNTPATRNGYLSVSSSSSAPVPEAASRTGLATTSAGAAITEDKVVMIATEQSRQYALLIRILKSNMALKMAVNALNAHTRLRTVDWEAMEELKDVKGMKGQKS